MGPSPDSHIHEVEENPCKVVVGSSITSEHDLFKVLVVK